MLALALALSVLRHDRHDRHEGSTATVGLNGLRLLHDAVHGPPDRAPARHRLISQLGVLNGALSARCHTVSSHSREDHLIFT
ncbi:hypothetical protein AB0M57_21790 [Streptomyces sp. NPDC051597]|uniref:hypothetical protein n=1 Tax=Streptomyces sp. NPDC051597 TaxID=3155049 RepID=UPI00341586E7